MCKGVWAEYARTHRSTQRNPGEDFGRLNPRGLVSGLAMRYFRGIENAGWEVK